MVMYNWGYILTASLLSNPKTRAMMKSVGMAAAKAAVGGIKRRRTKRIKNGQRVAGQRVRNRLLNAGVPLPISAPMGMSNTMGQRAPEQTQVVSKTELANSVSVQAVFVKHIIPINAADEAWFPSLGTIATQNQYYRFDNVSFTYAPNCSTTTIGSFCMCVVADYETANSISSMGEMLAHNYVKSSVYDGTASRLSVDSSQMNTQFLKQGWACRSGMGTDMSDPMEVQGFFVYATEGGAASSITGTLQVSYTCHFMKGRIAIGAVSAIDRFVHTGDFSVVTTHMQVYPNYDYPLWTVANTSNTTATVTYRDVAPYLMIWHGVDTADDTYALTGVDCTITSSAQNRHILGSFIYVWQVNPTQRFSVVTLTATGDTATQASLSFVRMRAGQLPLEL